MVLLFNFQIMITSQQFNYACGCRSPGECNGSCENPDAEALAINELVEKFADEMRAKLHMKRLKGFGGWDDPRYADEIRKRLREHVERGDHQAVDVANLAAMLWNFNQ